MAVTGTADRVVLWIALEPTTPADAQLLDAGLQRLTAEDPLLRVRPREAGQVIVAGVSESHLETTIDRLKREFRVAAGVGRLQVAYKESLTREAEGEGRFVRQTGGRGQYAHAKVRVKPLEREMGLRFADRLPPGTLPARFVEPIARGVQHAMERGVIAGCRVDDVLVELVDATYHEQDSSESAFTIAGALAFEQAAKRAAPVLTEPVMQLEISTPGRDLAAIIADLQRRTARDIAAQPAGDSHTVRARAPLRVLLGYEWQLQHLTGRRAHCTLRFDGYEPVEDRSRGDQDGLGVRVPGNPAPANRPPNAARAAPDAD